MWLSLGEGKEIFLPEEPQRQAQALEAWRRRGVTIPPERAIPLWPAARWIPAVPAEPLAPPGWPSLPDPPEPPGWSTFLLPLLSLAGFVGLAAWLYGGPRTGMVWVALPMAVGLSALGRFITHWEARRRHRRQIARLVQQFEAAVRIFQAEVHRRDSQWRHREELLAPTFDDLRRRVEMGRDLWFRRPGDPDFLSLRAGITAQPPPIRPVAWPMEVPDPLRPAMETLQRLAMEPRITPLLLSLQGGVAVQAGSGAERFLRAWWLDLAATHSPGDLFLAVGVGDPQWAPLRHLPHVGPLREGYQGGPTAVRERAFAELSDREVSGATAPAWILLADVTWLEDPRLPQLVARGPQRGLHPVFLLPPGVPPPAGLARHVLLMGHGQVWISEVSTGQMVEGQADTPVDALLFEALAQKIGRFYLPLPERSVEPSAWSLWALGEPETLDEAIRKMRGDPVRTLPVTIGLQDDGKPFDLDLHDRAHGPHAMLIGATGSGKSEAMRTLALALALRFPPERVRMLFIDFKGGGAFAPLADLPHAVGLLSNLDAREAARALETLEAELDRRQRVLREAGADHADQVGLPHLFVFADEFAEMLDQIPEGAARMIRLARLGRSLGMHLVLAAQRLGSAVPADLRANLRTRIALRCETPEESAAVLGRPDAAYLRGAGWAFLQVGQNELFRRIRFAYPSGASHRQPVPLIWMTPDRILHVEREDAEGPRDLDRLVEALKRLDPPAPPLVAPPWPEDPGEPEGEGADRIGIGLADFPEAGALSWIFATPVCPDLRLWGRAGTGKTRALQAMARSAAAAGRAVYVLDGNGEWSGVPGVEVIAPEDTEALRRLPRFLGDLPVPTVLILDGWEALSERALDELESEGGNLATSPRLWIWAAGRVEPRWRLWRGRPAHRVVLALEDAEQWAGTVGRRPMPEGPLRGVWQEGHRWREILLRGRGGVAEPPPPPPLPRAPRHLDPRSLPPPLWQEGEVHLFLGWRDEDLQPWCALLDRRFPHLRIEGEPLDGWWHVLRLQAQRAGADFWVWDPDGGSPLGEGMEDLAAFLDHMARAEAAGRPTLGVLADLRRAAEALGYRMEVPYSLRRPRWVHMVGFGRETLGLSGWVLSREPPRGAPRPRAVDHPGRAWAERGHRGEWILVPAGF